MSDIVVTSSTQEISVNPATGSVSVVNAGPQGPPGTGGGPGGVGSVDYVEYGDTPADEPDVLYILLSNAGIDDEPPTTPTALDATAGDGLVNLTWNASTDNIGVIGYRVYVDGSLWTTTTVRDIDVTGLTNGVEYDFQVAAIDGAANASAMTAIVSETPVEPGSAPDAPTGVGSSSITFNSFIVTWTDPTGPVTGVRLYLDGVLTDEVGGGVESLYVEGLLESTAYDVTLIAYNGAGDSDPTSVHTVTTLTAGIFPVRTGLLGIYVADDFDASYDDGNTITTAWPIHEESGLTNASLTSGSPTFDAVWANGKPAVYFAGNGLFTADIADYTGSMTVFIVCDFAATGALGALSSMSSNTTVKGFELRQAAGNREINYRNDAGTANQSKTYSDANVLNTPMVYEFVFNGTNLIARKNGSAVGTPNTDITQGAITAIRIGARRNDSAGTMNGRIGAIAIYNSALAEADRNTTVTGLMAYYGIT